MKNLTNSEYWNLKWKNIVYNKNENNILFSDIFKKFLKKNKKGKCIEIGCIPGRFLIYLAKNFGYKVYGIDFADTKKTIENMSKNGIKNFKLYQQDFLKFKMKEKFDVVCSFGFIEHFDNYEEIFKRHVNLMKDSGRLIIELPNFMHFQGKLHRLFNNENLKRHNIKIMDLNILKDLCRKNNLGILYLNYYSTVDFWLSTIDKHNLVIKLTLRGLRPIFYLINRYFNIPNKYLSPYIVLVAEKINTNLKLR